MKIQEMRSGISHLPKKVETVRRENVISMHRTAEPLAEREAAPMSELDEPRWSVISFDKCEAASLPYMQAADFMSLLDARGVAGLCIVTDEAAMRIRG